MRSHSASERCNRKVLSLKLLPFDYAARNLGRSPVRMSLSIAGSTLVILLVLTSTAFVNGMKQSLRVSGSDKNVIILGSGSEESIERSEIDHRTATIVAASVPGIRTRLNVPYVSPEIHMALNVGVDADDQEGELAVIRGVDSRAFLVHPQVRITEGRAPESGNDEIIVGRLVASKLGLADDALNVGSLLYIDSRPFEVVGTFEAPRTVMDAEIWCPLTNLQIVAQRDSLSCVVLTLDTAEFADIDAFAGRRFDLKLEAILESEYYRSLASFFAPIRTMVMVTAALIAVGGIFGGLNTMYAAFASRIREMGTLQTLGFRRFAVVVSLIQESVLMSAIGTLLAIGLGMLLLDGVAVRFSMGAFGLIVDHTVVLFSLLTGVALGFVGALPPAFRCMNLPIPQALKSG